MNWSNITLEQYQEVVSIAETDYNKDDMFTYKDEITPSSEFRKEIELVCYLYNLPKDEVLNMPIEKFKEYSKKLDFLQTAYEGNMSKEFELNGVTYVVGYEVQKRTAGQFIDLSELTKEPDMVNDNLHKILAVICIPKGSKYDGNINERAEVFKQLPMTIVFPISSFFLQVLKNSFPIIQDYLMEDIQKKKKELLEMIKDSPSIGGGIAL